MTATEASNPPTNAENMDANSEIQIGQSYSIRRQDGTLHEATVIQSRKTEDNVKEFYVHYSGLNRRLDQWVTIDQILPVNTNEEEETTSAENSKNQSPAHSTTTTAIGALDVSTISDTTERKITRNQKRRHDEINHVQKPYSEMDPTTAALEKEHEAITKVKYIDTLRIGKFEIDTWYFSPYPDEYGKVKTLYVCQYCLKYMKYEATYRRHCVSNAKHPSTHAIVHTKTFDSIYRKNAQFDHRQAMKFTAKE